MIVLLTGASHTGKTKLAQRLLERKGWPYLSLDHLKMGLIRSGQTPLTPLSGDAALPALLWPIAREIARTCAENGQNLVLEGCYIPADWRAGLDAATCAQVRAVCLALSEGFLRAQFAQVCAHASDVERRAGETLTLDWLLAQNAAFAPYDAAHGWTRLCIEADYEREMQAFWEGSEWKTTF